MCVVREEGVPCVCVCVCVFRVCGPYLYDVCLPCVVHAPRAYGRCAHGHDTAQLSFMRRRRRRTADAGDPEFMNQPPQHSSEPSP